MPNMYEINIHNLKDQQIADKSRIEGEMAEHLDSYLVYDGDKLFNSPITSLYNIFSHPRRKFTQHNLAYELIHKHSKKDKNLNILIPFIDGNKLSKKNLEIALFEMKSNNRIVPNLDYSYIMKLEYEINQLKKDRNVLYLVIVFISLFFIVFGFYYKDSLNKMQIKYQNQLDIQTKTFNKKFKNNDEELKRIVENQNNDYRKLRESNVNSQKEFRSYQEANKHKFKSIENNIDKQNSIFNQKLINTDKKFERKLNLMEKNNLEKLTEIKEDLLNEKDERNNEISQMNEKFINKIDESINEFEERLKEIKEEQELLKNSIDDTARNNESTNEKARKQFNESIDEIERQLSIMMNLIKENKDESDDKIKLSCVSSQLLSLFSICASMVLL